MSGPSTWQCPNVSRCRLFPRIESEVRLRFCLDDYCFGEFESCARFVQVRTTKVMPDDDLLPNGKRLDEGRGGATPIRRGERDES